MVNFKVMSCTHPIYAIDNGLDPDTGKHRIKLLSGRPDISNLKELERKYGASIISLPCGHCLSCKVNYAREWSIRCMLEACLYADNWFLTLTYDDVHLPKDQKICKRDIQLFIKKLRNYVPGLRYFCCGEYGEHTHRPHYHLILFNCKLDDVKCVSKGRLGGFYFDSKLLRDTWSKGQITLGEVTPNSCEYVARYCMKKINGDEFLLMSNRPGIGAKYCFDKYQSIYDTDGVYVKGNKYKVPRYFDKILERIDPIFFKLVKGSRDDKPFYRSKRLALLGASGFEYDEQLYEYQAQCDLDKFKNKKKGAL